MLHTINRNYILILLFHRITFGNVGICKINFIINLNSFCKFGNGTVKIFHFLNSIFFLGIKFLLKFQTPGVMGSGTVIRYLDIMAKESNIVLPICIPCNSFYGIKAGNNEYYGK